MLAIANGKWAGGTRIAPRANLDDGLPDLLLVPEISLLKLPALLDNFRALEKVSRVSELRPLRTA